MDKKAYREAFVNRLHKRAAGASNAYSDYRNNIALPISQRISEATPYDDLVKPMWDSFDKTYTGRTWPGMAISGAGRFATYNIAQAPIDSVRELARMTGTAFGRSRESTLNQYTDKVSNQAKNIVKIRGNQVAEQNPIHKNLAILNERLADSKALLDTGLARRRTMRSREYKQKLMDKWDNRGGNKEDRATKVYKYKKSKNDKQITTARDNIPGSTFLRDILSGSAKEVDNKYNTKIEVERFKNRAGVDNLPKGGVKLKAILKQVANIKNLPADKQQDALKNLEPNTDVQEKRPTLFSKNPLLLGAGVVAGGFASYYLYKQLRKLLKRIKDKKNNKNNKIGY